MKSWLARFSIASALVVALLAPTAGWARVSVFIDIAPPPLLVYAQPVVPGEGYIWTPGYWSWSPSDNGYYWVPGTWVLAPMAGYLWTPGYWAFEDAGYLWRRGYWGRRVGFYGGLNYGYGYSGSGYHGGRWDHGAFRYNRAVSNVDTRIVRNVYNARPVGHPGPAPPRAEPRAQPPMQTRVQTNPGPKAPPIQRVQREPQARSERNGREGQAEPARQEGPRKER